MRQIHRPEEIHALPFANRARRSIVLLQSLAALFVTTRHHAREDIQRFEELVHQLLGDVDATARRRFGEVIAASPAVPLSVIRRLAFDVPQVAEPILRASPLLTRSDIIALARLGREYRRHLAARPDLPAESRRLLVEDGDMETMTASARRDPAEPSLPEEAGPDGAPDREARGHSPALLRKGAGCDELIALFPIMEQVDRLRLLDLLENDEWRPEIDAARDMLRRFSPSAGARLVELARRGEMSEFCQELAAALRVEVAVVERILRDHSGEMLAVALKAIGCDEETLTRIVMASRPDIGRSVERFFSLVRFHRRLSRAISERLVRGWARTPEASPPQAGRWGERRGEQASAAQHRGGLRRGRNTAGPQKLFSLAGTIRRAHR